MDEGSIMNTGGWKSPFSVTKSPKQSGSDSIMGMRGSDATGDTKPVVQVQVPPSTGGGGGGIKNTGNLVPGAKPLV